jgi:hypothetical protein
MMKSVLLAAIQKEILRHDFGTYVDDPPTIAQGGRGIVVAGCPACKKRLQSMNEFLRHLAEDAMPSLLNQLSSNPNGQTPEKAPQASSPTEAAPDAH